MVDCWINMSDTVAESFFVVCPSASALIGLTIGPTEYIDGVEIWLALNISLASISSMSANNPVAHTKNLWASQMASR